MCRGYMVIALEPDLYLPERKEMKIHWQRSQKLFIESLLLREGKGQFATTLGHK